MAVDGLTLDYAPGSPATAEQREPVAVGATPAESRWPPLTQLSGELVIDRGSLSFRDARAQLLGVELVASRGGIANLADRPTLTLNAQARGPLADMLGFVDTTPIGDWLHGALHETRASGNGSLGFALTLPLADPTQSTVGGSLQLDGSDLSLRRDLPLLGAAHGRIDFTRRGLAIVGASARVLGGETAIEGGTQPDGSLRFNAQGGASPQRPCVAAPNSVRWRGWQAR